MYLVSTLTQILPLALAAAVSPTALMGIILILSVSKKPKLQGFGYYLGALFLILIVVVIGMLLGAGISSTTSKPGPILAIVDVVLGIILLLLGIMRIRKPQKVANPVLENDSKIPSNTVTLIKGFSFGFGMFLINFSTTILVLDAGKEIAVSSADLMGKLIIIIILTIITLLVCEVPLLLYILFPEKANDILSNVNKWMQKNSHYLMGIVIIVIGVYLVFNGFIKLGFF